MSPVLPSGNLSLIRCPSLGSLVTERFLQLVRFDFDVAFLMTEV